MLKQKIPYQKSNSILFLFVLCFVLLTCTNICLAAGSQSKSPSALLQEGLYAEEIEGDLDAAIETYQQVIDDSSTQKNQIAQALYRQGLCYIKKQDEDSARRNFQNLVANFSEQTNIIEQVQPLLDDMANVDPAELMPPDTLLYIELGSPGRQIETLLNMLKGSPLENPLDVLNIEIEGSSQDQMNPQNIIGALLNPSMMAEFQKIKGMGIGISGIPINGEPPVVVVMFPGKSDALKGLLQMVLNMVGRPIESIEGMTCLNLDGGGAAYDDSVYIIVSPAAYQAGQLEWCIKQYKGITSEPTLASSNVSFTRLGKRSRQSNVLTFWADVDNIFTKFTQMFPVDSFPPQIQIANGIVDFQNIDDLIAFLTLEETSLAIEANLELKDGHTNLAYNLIRTPNLSDKGFQAMPSEAIAALSFALNDANSAQVQTIGQQLENITGLDFGRELFANIEQLTVFLLPPDVVPSNASQSDQILAIASSLGITITSKNPQKTQQIINQILTIASIAGMVSEDSINNQPIRDSGKYSFAFNNGLTLNCYMDRPGGTTVISLNPEIIDASIASLGSGNSAVEAGPLQKPLSEISPSTSKIVMLNLGGLMQFVQAMVNGSNPEEVENVRNLFGQLAEGFKDTTIQLRTNESQNNLNIRAALSDIPPVNTISTPIMQLMSQMHQNAPSGRWIPPSPRIAVIAQTDTPVVIDGIEDDTWSQIERYSLSNKLVSPDSSDEDISAGYKVMWDKDNLYFYINVIDDVLQSTSTDFSQNDSIIIFIDSDNTKSVSYDDNDYHFYFILDRNNPAVISGNGTEVSSDIQFKFNTEDIGYNLEVKFPLETLGIEAKVGTQIGLDVRVTDNDDGGDRDQIITWRDTEGTAIQDTSVFGTAELAGLVGWWKLDEGSGSTVADSSDSGVDGTIHNTSAGLGRDGSVWYNDPDRGTVLSLNGDNINGAYVSAGTIPAMTLTNCFTWAFWAKQDGIANDDTQYDVLVGNRFGGNDDLQFIKFTPTSFEYYNNGVQDGIDYDDIPDGMWIHHALVKNGTSLKYYRNGVESGSNTVTVPIEANPLYIGGDADTNNTTLSGERWCGFIDDVRIYNYALDQEEIEKLYNNSR